MSLFIMVYGDLCNYGLQSKDGWDRTDLILGIGSLGDISDPSSSLLKRDLILFFYSR